MKIGMGVSCWVMAVCHLGGMMMVTDAWSSSSNLATGTFRSSTSSVVSSSSSSSSSSSRHMAYIKGDTMDGQEELVDIETGGVRLAKTTAICMAGVVKPETDDVASVRTLERYNHLTPLGGPPQNVICTGTGQEEYKDPGTGTAKEITYGPMDAIQKLLASANGVPKKDNHVAIHVAGGSDLILSEVADAMDVLVDALGLTKKSKHIVFSSISHPSISSGSCSFTVLDTSATQDDDDDTTASQPIFLADGSWYTLSKSDLNDDIE
eukprot:scaffold15536_cov55-Attheya_sp.AAC.1